jgi:hypothetical protein
LDAKHRLDVVDIYVKLFKNPLLHDKVTSRTRLCEHINTNCDNVKHQNVSLTLTFEVGMWFLNATHRLDVVDVCAKLFHNPSMYDKVTVQTQINSGRTQTLRF